MPCASTTYARAAATLAAASAWMWLAGGEALGQPAPEPAGGPPDPNVIEVDPDDLEVDDLWGALPAPADEARAPDDTPPAAQPPHPPVVPLERRHALIIGLDGVRPDALQRARTPHLSRLAREGAFSYSAEAASVTLSGPGWAALLTGVERDKHGIRDNRIGEGALNGWPTLFARLRAARPDATTAAFVAWRPLHDFMLSPRHLDQRVFHRSDARVAREAAAALREGDPTLTFVHLDEVDRAGHRHGYRLDRRAYVSAIEQADARVGALLEAIDARPHRRSEAWLVVVTTDHGGTGTRHGANRPTDRRIFMLLHGATVQPGPLPGTPRLLDVAPTVLSYLGVPADPRRPLEGVPVGLVADARLTPTAPTAAAGDATAAAPASPR